ncbi:BUD13 homolog isoform X2 [Hydra vulgaris]|uniref:BUD13 homolog n=1 Tax=Hydra vulgaris TaxID=6087 RepID=A0ABM4BDC2_HYDVU
MASSQSKLEYLKKYIDKPESSKKKKKKESKIKIIDHHISLNDISNNSDEDVAIYDTQEEKPLLLTNDGINVITKEYSEQQNKNKLKWAPLATDIDNGTQRKRHDSSGSDLSPVRKQQRHDSSCSDQSPPRKQTYTNDCDSDSDLSPVRLSEKSEKKESMDFSPHRKNKRKNDSGSDLSPVRLNEKSISDKNTDTKKRSGLQSREELKKENESKRRHEENLFNNMSTSVSGKDAQTIYRDQKSGKKIDLKAEEIKKKLQEEEKMKELKKYAEWGKGVTQEKDYQQKLKDDVKEMQKPLARYKDDKDLDDLLRNKSRDEDPMLNYIIKSKSKNKLQKPKYNGPTPPPNRFNIWPGYRYDGVDRSNGFEKRRFMEISKRKSFETEKYKWSVEDM